MLFTDSPPAPSSEWHQTRAGYEQNSFPVCCRDTKKFHKKRALPEIHEEGDQIRLEVLTLSVWTWICRRNQWKSIFVYKMQITVILLVLYLANMFINKFKTNLIRGTHWWIPPKYVENTFRTIQCTFRSLEIHSKRRYNILLILGELESFRNYKGLLSSIFPKFLDAI